MQLPEKLDQARAYLGEIENSIKEAEATRARLEVAKQQVIGRIQTYQELLEEQQEASEKPATPPARRTRPKR